MSGNKVGMILNDAPAGLADDLKISDYSVLVAGAATKSEYVIPSV